jgi:hypothetical protein
MLVGLPLAKTINIHYEIIIKYSKPHLISSSPNYSWFMQHVESDNKDVKITQFPLGMNFQPYHL